jgi:hypothetical protein
MRTKRRKVEWAVEDFLGLRHPSEAPEFIYPARPRDFAHRCIPTQPHVAPHTEKIHTLITLGIRDRTKPLVLRPRARRTRGFDSHRPLHFSWPGVSLRCPRRRLSASPSSHRLDAATVHLIECVDRPSVELVLDGLVGPSSTEEAGCG